MALEHWDEAVDGPFSEAALRTKMTSRGYTVSRCVYPAGIYFPDHQHAIDKLDGVVSGRFRMRMGEIDVVLEAGDVLAVPAGAVHSAEVVGSEPVVSLDGIRR